MDDKGHFQKGESGNPKGRPKVGEAITDLFREYLEGKDNDNSLSRKQLLVEELYSRAMGKKRTDKKGNIIKLPGSDELLRYIVNRLDGMPRQALDLEAFVSGDEALTVFIERSSDARPLRAGEERSIPKDSEDAALPAPKAS